MNRNPIFIRDDAGRSRHAPIRSARPTIGGLRSRIVAGRELPESDVDRWKRLQAANPALAGPYLCPAYTRAVASVRSDVRVAILERDGELLGYFPFQQSAFGRGRPVGGPLSDYQAVITAENDGWTAEDVIRACGLTLFDFDHLLAIQAPFSPHVIGRAESPIIDLSRGFDSYVAERRAAGSKQVASLGNLWRKFEREVKPLRFDPCTTDATVLSTLLRWKSQQCLSTGGVDIFGFHWTNELIERLLHTQDDGFAGVLSALWAGDELIAAHFGMRSRSIWHYWFPSYNHEHAKYSPGLLLLLEMAKVAPAMGITAIDMGKGEAAYKDRMRNGAVEIVEGRVEIPSIATSLRKLRVDAERWVKSSSLASIARFPGRVIKGIERRLRYR